MNFTVMNDSLVSRVSSRFSPVKYFKYVNLEGVMVNVQVKMKVEIDEDMETMTF